MENNLEKLINAKFEGLEKYIESKFIENKAAHERLEAHAIQTNGNVKKNTDFRLKMEAQTKVWIGIATFLGLSGVTNIVLAFK